MKIAVSLLIFLSCACASNSAKQELQPAKDYFVKTEACFLLYNMKTQQFEKTIGEENCRKSYPACSTFKVPLSVMAFDAKVLKDENEILKWDGKKDEREAVNHDHNAKTWMRDSVVWFSQRITPKLGKKRFQKYLDQFNYGNKDISAGIKTAWLVLPNDPGPALKISAYEQVDFMKKLWANKLPASARAIQLTKEITFLETSPKGFRLSGKTGSSFYDKDRKVALGWFVSHLEKEDKEYLAVTNFRDLEPFPEKSYGGLRAKEVTKQILTDQGLW